MTNQDNYSCLVIEVVPKMPSTLLTTLISHTSIPISNISINSCNNKLWPLLMDNSNLNS